jgi:hypothetical protein
MSQISFVDTLSARKYLNFFVAIIRIFLCFCQEKNLVKGKDKTMGKEVKLIEAASIACRGLEGERIQWRFVLPWQGVRGAYGAFSTLLRDLTPFLCLVTSAPLPP